MKRLFTLFIIACILGGNAWGRGLFFYNKIVEFDYNSSTSAWESNCNLTMTHISSDSSGDTYEVAQDVMWEWYSGATPNNMGQQDSYIREGKVQDVEFYWSLDVSGSGITTPNVFIEKHVDNHYELKQDVDHGHRVRFTLASNATSGSIRVTVLQPDFEDPNTHEHSTYSATYTIKINQKIPSKKWNFYSNQMAIGRSGDSSKPLYAIKSVLTKETTTGFDTEGTNALFWYNTGLTADATNGEDFIFHYNTSDSYTVPEAAGLKFYAPTGTIGIANDENVAGASKFRYIALKPGAKVIVPKSTWSSWTDSEKSHLRVRVKMGRYGAPSTPGAEPEGAGIVLTIHNATDALKNTITAGTYKIGGCAWWGDKGDNNQRGEYHFNITNANADFAIEVYSGQWLELYSIEVYSSTDMITENNLLGDKYQLLNIDGSGAAANGTYYLHYRGKGETTEIDPIYTTGTVSSSNFTTGDYIKHTYTSTQGQFGTFRIRMKCRTMDYSGHQYCTDYAWRTMSVGYRETQTYPYTWDFADVHTYKYTDGYKLDDGRMGTEGTYYYDSDVKEQRLWLDVYVNNVNKGVQNPSAIRLASDGGHNVNYCGGSQLWYGTTMIPESKGLGFTPVNYDYVYNSSLTIQEGSIKFHQGMRDWWGWRVTVPSVPANGAVYVRAKEIGTSNLRHVKFWIKDVGDVVSNKTEGETDFYDSEYSSETYHNKVLVEGSSDEYIYAIYNDATNAKDITLFFNEVEVQKIAVSTDKKTFNALGWTTESRDHDIDPSLTAEMNGRNITTYLVTGVDYTKKRVTMTPINDYLMPAASGDHQPEACILKNSTESTLNIVNGGFYLFVPDMHDEQGATEGSGYKLKNYYNDSEHPSKMKSKLYPAYPAGYQGSGSQVGIPIPYQSEGYTNFAFTYQYYALDGSGNTDGDVINGVQGFYRIAANGGWSYGNQGYLPLVTSQIDSDTMGGRRGFELSFDEDEGGEVTAIENIETSKSEAVAETAIYYSLSGQKLSGKPAKGGIYICNGKKIAIK